MKASILFISSSVNIHSCSESLMWNMTHIWSHIFHHRTSFIKSPEAIHQSWQNTPQTLQRLFLAAGMLILLFAKLSLISPRFLFCDIQVASLQQQWQIKPKRASISPADGTERTSLCIRTTLVAGTWFAKLLAPKRCNLAGKKKQRYTEKNYMTGGRFEVKGTGSLRLHFFSSYLKFCLQAKWSWVS